MSVAAFLGRISSPVTRTLVSVLPLLVLGVQAQAQDAFTVVSGEKLAIPIRIKTETPCNIEITIKDRKEQRSAEAPNFEINLEFQGQDLGVTEITWEGRFRARGLNSRMACPGSGKIQVTTVVNTEQRKAEWARIFSPLRPDQRQCLQVGLAHRGVRFDSLDPRASLDPPSAPAARDVFARCDSFFLLPRVWGTNNPDDYPCTLANNLRTRCVGSYAERLPDGQLAPIGIEAAIVFHMDGKSWTTTQREIDSVREARERAARDAAEKERLFRESPEFKRQQAELERRRAAEMLLAEEKLRQEKEALDRAARLRQEEEARQQAERERVAREAAERVARLRAEEEERRRAELAERERVAREAAERAARVRAEEEERRRAEQAQFANNFPYYALVTCGFRGQHTNVLACFGGRVGTELELRNGSSYGLYKVHEIRNLGQETREGLRIDLRRNFELKAQNSDDTLILGVKIIDRRTNETVFERQVSRFGVISVRN